MRIYLLVSHLVPFYVLETVTTMTENYNIYPFVWFLVIHISKAMSFTADIAAFTKREHACRIRLVGVMTLVLVLALTVILPTLFQSPISNSSSSTTTSDSLLLRLRLLQRGDACERERDGCVDDPNKDKPGVCGCGVPDIDTDGDGTLDCLDGCPHHASKTTPGVCGCDTPETGDTDGDGTLDCIDSCPHDASKTSPGACNCSIPDTDADRDGTPDCHDDCVYNDPFVRSSCDYWYGYDCEGCAKKNLTVWKDCGTLCSNNAKYCIDYSVKFLYEYAGSVEDYSLKSIHDQIIQIGANSSNSIWVFTVDCDQKGNCVEKYSLNGVSCNATYSDKTQCLECVDGKKYCYEEGVPPSTDNPYFYRGEDGRKVLSDCFDGASATPSELEIKALERTGSRHMRALFHNGA